MAAVNLSHLCEHSINGDSSHACNPSYIILDTPDSIQVGTVKGYAILGLLKGYSHHIRGTLFTSMGVPCTTKWVLGTFIEANGESCSCGIKQDGGY